MNTGFGNTACIFQHGVEHPLLAICWYMNPLAAITVQEGPCELVVTINTLLISGQVKGQFATLYPTHGFLLQIVFPAYSAAFYFTADPLHPYWSLKSIPLQLPHFLLALSF